MHTSSHFAKTGAVKRSWRRIGVGLLLAALVPVIALALLGRSRVRQEALNLFQPVLTAFNQVSLDQSLQQAGAAGAEAAAIAGPLRRNPADTRYLVDPTGKPVYLTGSHTWASLQDNGNGYPPPQFDYTKYLDFLTANNHNFFRLWTWEQSRWTLETADDNYWFYPDTPYVRTGPGNALDGKAKWDLTQFNQAYFDRMRQRIIAAGARGIYVSIMLFDGWSVVSDQDPQLNNPWKGHPFNAANNINGINGDVNNDNNGRETHTLAVPAVTALQEAYVKKVIDTVNDLDNVLYEIDNEGPNESLPWQKHMVDYIRGYEAGKAKQHPIGVTGRYEWSVDSLVATGADWISPGGNAYQSNPPVNTTSAVIINDTDHLWGIGGDRVWVWKNFTRGLNPIFMDCYDGAGYGVGGAGCNFSDPTWVKLRANMGYTRQYAERMNLAAVTPRQSLCSTAYCLANPTSGSAEFLVYQPGSGAFTVNLSGVSGALNVEWLNPDTGAKSAGNAVQGGAVRTFTPPFGGDAVLYLYQTTVQPTPTPTATATPTASFPSTPVRDNFNRPNGQAGTRWIDPASIFRVKSLRLTASATGQAFWQAATFGADQEAFAALAVMDKATELGVLLKVQQSNGTMTGAVKVSYVPADGVVRVATYTQADGWQAVGSDVKASFIDGDKLGARVHKDGSVELYKNGGLIGRNSVAGWAYAASGGRIGVHLAQPASAAALDNFGGGDVTSGTVQKYVLEVAATVEGQGHVTVDPPGAIVCGQQVTIQAVPAAGWVFTGWDGDVVDSANPLTYSLTGSLYLTARFQPSDTPAALTVTVGADGKGKVVVEPPGPYMNNQAVKLTAVAETGWVFEGWEGVSAGKTDNPLAFNVTQDTSLTATFVAGKFVYLPQVANGVNSTAATAATTAAIAATPVAPATIDYCQ